MAARRPDTIKRESVIDGELVSCDSDGRPEFAAITKNHDNLCIWCFDLSYRGGDVREKPLVERKEMLRELLITLDDDRLSSVTLLSSSRSLTRWAWKASCPSVGTRPTAHGRELIGSR